MTRDASVLVAATFLLVACGGPEQTAPGTLLGADLRPESEVVEEEPGPDGLVLRLLERGDPPHRPLRYERRAGHRETGRIHMMMSVTSAGSDGSPGEHRTAPVSLDFAVGPTEADEQGRFRLRIRVTEVRVELPADTPADVLADVNRQAEPLRALDTTLVVDDRGIVHEISGAMPEELSPETRTLLSSIRTSLLSPVLPGPAVGEGAVWEVKEVVDHGDFRVDQIMSYELVSSESHTGRLQVTLRQHAPPGTLEDGDELNHFSTIGGGYLEYDLRHLVPEAQLSSRTHVESGVRNPESLIVPIQSEMSVAIRVEPVR